MVDAKASRHQLSGDSYSAVVMPAELYDPTNLPYDNECVVWRSIVAEVAFSGWYTDQGGKVGGQVGGDIHLNSHNDV
jgi:hypothetical protein